MIDKHIVVASLLTGGRKWKTIYDVLGPDVDGGLIDSLLHMVASGTVETRVKHHRRNTGMETVYRLSEGSKYRMLVA